MGSSQDFFPIARPTNQRPRIQDIFRTAQSVDKPEILITTPDGSTRRRNTSIQSESDRQQQRYSRTSLGSLGPGRKAVQLDLGLRPKDQSRRRHVSVMNRSFTLPISLATRSSTLRRMLTFNIRHTVHEHRTRHLSPGTYPRTRSRVSLSPPESSEDTHEIEPSLSERTPEQHPQYSASLISLVSAIDHSPPHEAPDISESHDIRPFPSFDNVHFEQTAGTLLTTINSGLGTSTAVESSSPSVSHLLDRPHRPRVPSLDNYICPRRRGRSISLPMLHDSLVDDLRRHSLSKSETDLTAPPGKPYLYYDENAELRGMSRSNSMSLLTDPRLIQEFRHRQSLSSIHTPLSSPLTNSLPSSPIRPARTRVRHPDPLHSGSFRPDRTRRRSLLSPVRESLESWNSADTIQQWQCSRSSSGYLEPFTPLGQPMLYMNESAVYRQRQMDEDSLLTSEGSSVG